MKKILTTFGNSTWANARNKLVQSAKNNGFHGVAEFDEYKIEPEFYEKNKAIFQFRRGFGFWVWKPYIILKTLNMMNDGDVVLYSDSGSFILRPLDELFQLCKENDGILLFDNRDGTENENIIWKNKNWTKSDCFNMMNCTEEKYLQGNQVDACYQMYEKNPKSIEFVNEYQKYCENINIVTNVPDITPRPAMIANDWFQEHRHDQSILSLLAIKHNIKIEREPSQWGYRTNQQDLPKIKFYHHRNPNI